MRHGPHETGPRPQLLVALCGAGFLLFNFPLITLWKGDFLGLPLLPVALFGLWFLLILALALASRRPRKAPAPGRDPGTPPAGEAPP